MAVNGASVDSRLTGTAKANSPIMRNNFRKVQPSKTGPLPFLDNYCIECHEDERVREKLSVEQIGPLKPSVMKMLAPKPYFWSRGYTISVSLRS